MTTTPKTVTSTNSHGKCVSWLGLFAVVGVLTTITIGLGTCSMTQFEKRMVERFEAAEKQVKMEFDNLKARLDREKK